MSQLLTHFHMLADAHPGLLARLLEPFARRDLIPDSIHAQRDADSIRARITATLTADEAHRIAGNLRATVGLHHLHIETVTDRLPIAA